MNKVFWTFKRQGKTLLLIPNGPNCTIIDDDGNNYGTYTDLKSFERFAEKDGGIDNLKLGRADVQFRCLPKA